jgi:ATP-dependent helicase HrpB
MATHSRLSENRIPEILEADLAPLMLDMAAWGVTDIQKLTWLTPPPKGTTAQASELLEQLGATQKGKITPHGKLMHGLACHPRIAHMLLMAETAEQKQLGTDIAAVLEERDPLPKDSGIDINLRIEALRRARSMGNSGGRFARIEKVAAQYRSMIGLNENNGTYDPHEAGLLLAYAYPERIAFARPGNNAQFQLANGRYAAAGHRDDLAHEPWLVAANVDQREGLGKIFIAAPLNPKDLLPLVKEEEVLAWDTRKGGLISSKDLRIGTIVLQSKPLVSYNKDAAEKVIWRAVQNEGENLLDFGDEMTMLQNRILSLRKWNGKEEWPDVSTENLLNGEGEWLRPYLHDIKKADDLKKVNVAEALLHSLSYEQQNALNKLAPSRLDVPSGSKIQIKYFPNGETPVLAVRLQELFGLAETPTINNGKNPMVLHLLSPGYKPVQVTSDLKSFWDNLYHDVKKELQRRYPKHAWPDDPWSAKAVAKGRSQR